MIKKALIILVILIAIFIAGYKILQTKRAFTEDYLKPASAQQIIARYDTGSNTIVRVKDSVLHYTLKWENDSEKSLPTELLASLSEKKLPIFINLQIWSRTLIGSLDEQLETVILTGGYDAKLIALFKTLAKFAQPVYLNFNPEMEVPDSKYPWQYQSGMLYIQTFRHIALLGKKYSPAVQIVWGPSGYPGAEGYWPGNEYVDIIGVNMSLSPEIKKDPFPPYKSATDMTSRKLFRMRFMNRPVLLLATESMGRSAFQQQWIDEINNKLFAEKDIYRTPVIPIDTDSKQAIKKRDSGLKIGVYDPFLLLTNQPVITVEHLFPNLGTVKDGSFKKEFDAVIARHHDVIVTMEAWRDGEREKDSSILVNTLNGTYDKVWAMLYEIIGNSSHTVYLRWGHEMEIPVDRYPWQKQDPVTYIKAFRYFANFQQPRANNIKIVWGPTGDRGCMEWWPGEDVVDYVSIAIYGLPDKNINDYNKQHSFSDIFHNKFHRIRFTHKPIFITEFGVKGPESFQKKWLEEATTAINQYPQIIGVSYFNSADTPKAWGDAETPNWSITVETLKSFTALLKDL